MGQFCSLSYYIVNQNDSFQVFFEFTNLEYFKQKIIYVKFGIFVNPDILPFFFLYFFWKMYSQVYKFSTYVLR